MINDNLNEVTCRLCGEKVLRIYGKHLKFKHNMTSKEYRSLFPDAPLFSKSDLINTSKNSGKHMKKQKYKKMFSEMISGVNNPNHKSKTTQKQRKSRSPFSKYFLKYKDITNKDEHISNFVKESIKDRIGSTTLEYFINKGLSEADAKENLRERQITFSLKKCIEKYGEEGGRARWMKRQEKWLSSYKKVNYSKISQDLFINLYFELKRFGFHNRVYFARLDDNGFIHDTNKNFEFRLKLKKSFVIPDFFIPDLRLVIEFDGTYFHRNTPENKKREHFRDLNIQESGYEVIHVLESEYLKHKNRTIDELVKIIIDKKEFLQNG